MRVTFIVQRCLPAKLSGSEFFVARLAPHLQQRGINVTIITSNTTHGRAWFMPQPWAKINPAIETRDGICVTRLPVQWYRAAYWTTLHRLTSRFLGESSINQVQCFGPYLKHFYRALVNSHPDIIHAVTFPASYLHQLSRLRLSAPIILTPFYHPLVFGQTNPGLKNNSDNIRRIMAVTYFERSVLQKVVGSRIPIDVIPLGIDSKEVKLVKGARFRQQHGLGRAFTVLYIGNKCYDKGTNTTLHAIRQLNRQSLSIRLVTVGHSSREWEREIQPTDKTFLVDLPYASEQVKAEALAAADLLCMPSRVDSFGFAFLEAWLAKKPVIGALGGATPELITDGVNGKLVNFGHVPELASTIVFFLNNRQARHDYGKAGYDKVTTQLTSENMTTKIIHTYSLILNNYPQCQK